MVQTVGEPFAQKLIQLLTLIGLHHFWVRVGVGALNEFMAGLVGNLSQLHVVVEAHSKRRQGQPGLLPCQQTALAFTQPSVGPQRPQAHPNFAILPTKGQDKLHLAVTAKTLQQTHDQAVIQPTARMMSLEIGYVSCPIWQIKVLS